ncbi:MAG: hypothetical protein IPN42_08490 [Methylococcaceae bacterium]|nr:hypothetical protein [Methylococcaceae bacterium]
MTTFTNETGSAVGSDGQIDTLELDYSALTGLFPNGIHIHHNDEQNVKNRTDGSKILNFSSIELFEITGTKGNDVIVGGDFDRNAGYAANPYDDDQLFGDDGDDHIEGRGGDDLLVGGNGNDTLIGGEGRDELQGGSGNDKLYGGASDRIEDFLGTNHIYANEAEIVRANDATTIHADYSTYSGTGILVENLPTGGIIRNGLGGSLTFDGGMAFEIKGTQQADTIGMTYNLSNNDFLFGNDGDDVINGGNGSDYLSGDAGNDILIGGQGADKLFGGDGDDILNDTEGFVSGGGGINTLTADYSLLSYNKSGIYFNAQDQQNIRELSTKNVILDYQEIQKFNITGTQNDDFLVGGSGDDILAGSKGNDTIQGSVGNDTIFAVAGIDKAIKQLSGGEGNDRFVLDISGEVTPKFSFNTATLAEFVNAITLPEYSNPDWKQIGIDVAFDAAAAGVGAIPVVGPLAGFLVSLGKTGFDIGSEQAGLVSAINGQLSKAHAAAANYSDANWGTITDSGFRDTININDFVIGKDTILLPKITLGQHFTVQANLDNGVDIYIKGNDNHEIKVAHVANIYERNAMSNSDFAAMVDNLFVNGEIGKFMKTPVRGGLGDDQLTSLTNKITFANDAIYADNGVFKEIKDSSGNFIGSEFDHEHLAGGNDVVYGFYGDDIIFGEGGNDSLYGGSRGEFSDFNRLYENNDGNDFLVGGTGNDTLNGGSGNDFLNGDATVSYNQALYTDNDTLIGGTGFDTLKGGAGNDILIDIDANVSGGIGIDTLQADYSNAAYGVNNDAGVHLGTIAGVSAVFERAQGTAVLKYDSVEKFNVTGTKFNDHLEGGVNADTLAGGAGNDDLIGNAGNDMLNGGLGADVMSGGLGNDIYTVDNSGDFVEELNGGGNDTVNASLTYTLSSFVDNMNLTGSAAINGIGNTLNNIMNGNTGNNLLVGLTGNDTLNGNAGNDTLSGGLGNDSLNGGAGLDRFLFNSALGAANKDTITGFNVADDTIVLENAIFTKFVTPSAGAFAVNAVNFVKGAGAVALDNNDFLVYNTSTGALSYDADGNGAGAALQIATLVGVPALTAADFLIV